MSFPLTLSLFVLLSPRQGSHPLWISAIRAEPSLPRVMHFRYFPQRSAPIPVTEDGYVLRHIHIGPRTARMDREGDVRSEVVHPNRRFVYSCADTFFVKQYRVGKGGRLHPLTPFKVGAHSHPMSISFHPNGRFAYVACSHGAICQYRLSHSGQFVPLPDSEVYVSSDPSPLRFDASGHFACVVSDGPDDIGQIASVYRVEREGTLTRIRKLPCRNIEMDAPVIIIHEMKVSAEK